MASDAMAIAAARAALQPVIIREDSARIQISAQPGKGPLYSIERGGSWRGARQLKTWKTFRIQSISIEKRSGWVEIFASVCLKDGSPAKRRSQAVLIGADLRRVRWLPEPEEVN